MQLLSHRTFDGNVQRDSEKDLKDSQALRKRVSEEIRIKGNLKEIEKTLQGEALILAGGFLLPQSCIDYSKLRSILETKEDRIRFYISQQKISIIFNTFSDYQNISSEEKEVILSLGFKELPREEHLLDTEYNGNLDNVYDEDYFQSTFCNRESINLDLRCTENLAVIDHQGREVSKGFLDQAAEKTDTFLITRQQAVKDFVYTRNNPLFEAFFQNLEKAKTIKIIDQDWRIRPELSDEDIETNYLLKTFSTLKRQEGSVKYESDKITYVELKSADPSLIDYIDVSKKELDVNIFDHISDSRVKILQRAKNIRLNSNDVDGKSLANYLNALTNIDYVDIYIQKPGIFFDNLKPQESIKSLRIETDAMTPDDISSLNKIPQLETLNFNLHNPQAWGFIEMPESIDALIKVHRVHLPELKEIYFDFHEPFNGNKCLDHARSFFDPDKEEDEEKVHQETIRLLQMWYEKLTEAGLKVTSEEDFLLEMIYRD